MSDVLAFFLGVQWLAFLFVMYFFVRKAIHIADDVESIKIDLCHINAKLPEQLKKHD